MDELEHKYQIEIKHTQIKQKLPQAIKDELKISGMMDEKGKLKLKGISPKMLKRMKQEYVECPVLNDDIQFIQCFVCSNFQSRVTGSVLCKGEPLGQRPSVEPEFSSAEVGVVASNVDRDSVPQEPEFSSAEVGVVYSQPVRPMQAERESYESQPVRPMQVKDETTDDSNATHEERQKDQEH